jgi:hypothetical protein
MAVNSHSGIVPYQKICNPLKRCSAKEVIRSMRVPTVTVKLKITGFE